MLLEAVWLKSSNCHCEGFIPKQSKILLNYLDCFASLAMTILIFLTRWLFNKFLWFLVKTFKKDNKEMRKVA
jgi:hypothetical protein